VTNATEERKGIAIQQPPTGLKISRHDSMGDWCITKNDNSSELFGQKPCSPEAGKAAFHSFLRCSKFCNNKHIYLPKNKTNTPALDEEWEVMPQGICSTNNQNNSNQPTRASKKKAFFNLMQTARTKLYNMYRSCTYTRKKSLDFPLLF